MLRGCAGVHTQDLGTVRLVRRWWQWWLLVAPLAFIPVSAEPLPATARAEDTLTAELGMPRGTLTSPCGAVAGGETLGGILRRIDTRVPKEAVEFILPQPF